MNILEKVNAEIGVYRKLVAEKESESTKYCDEIRGLYLEEEAEKRVKENASKIYNELSEVKKELEEKLYSEAEEEMRFAKEYLDIIADKEVDADQFFRASKVLEVATRAEQVQRVLEKYKDGDIREMAISTGKSLENEDERIAFNTYLVENDKARIAEAALINANVFRRTLDLDWNQFMTPRPVAKNTGRFTAGGQYRGW